MILVILLFMACISGIVVIVLSHMIVVIVLIACFVLISEISNIVLAINNLQRKNMKIKKKQFDYSTIIGYQRCCQIFQKMIREIAWHKNDYLDFAENSTGNYIFRVKDVSNTFFG